MTATDVEIRIQEKVATVVMNRPHSNAMSPSLMHELASAFQALERDPEVRVIVLASAFEGVFFSVGIDLQLVSGFDRASADAEARIVELFTPMGDCFETVAACRKPVVAAIYGHALGGGCELALCCDYRLMVEDGRSRIGLTEVQLGLMPADGATQRLPRLIGLARALPLLYEGSRLSATEAARSGLVLAVPPAEFGAALDGLTTRLSRIAPQAFALIKDAVRRGLELPLQAGLQLERENFARTCMSEDAVIGVSSFLTGKAPDFRGR